MIRSELIQKIADEHPDLSQREVERIVNTIFEEVIEAMARGDRVELRGFGVFSVHDQTGYTTVSPSPGEPLQVAPQRQVHFKAGAQLKAKLNP